MNVPFLIVDDVVLPSIHLLPQQYRVSSGTKKPYWKLKAAASPTAPRSERHKAAPLSPLLFIIGINSILELADIPGIHTQAYADDILVPGAAHTELEVQTKIQRVLDRMNSWAQERDLIFAPEKCLQIRFMRRRRRSTDSRPLYIQGQQLPQKSAVLYPGIWLDETLEWNPQIHSAARRVRSRLELIRRMTGSFWACCRKL